MTMQARVEIRASILGEPQLHRAIQGRIAAVSDLSPAFEKIADDFEESQGQRFAGEGAHDGAPAWAPLSDPYAAWKAKHFPGARILHLSGALEDALTGGPGSIREIEPLRMIVGGSIRVGSWDLGSLHQTGTRKMPARKPVVLGRRERSRWVRFILDRLRLEGRE